MAGVILSNRMVAPSVRCAIAFLGLMLAAPVRGRSAVDWEPVRHAGSGAAVESIAFTTSVTGWLLQRDGTLQASGDGGRTWTVRAKLAGPARRLAAGPGGVLVVAGDGVLWTSTDAGTGWRERAVGGGGSFNAVAFGPDGAIWAAGMGSEVQVSRDRGDTWVSAGRPGLGHLFAVAAGPGGCVLVGGLRGPWETRDGGRLWSYVNLDRGVAARDGPRPVIADLIVAPDGAWIAGWLGDFALLWRADWTDPAAAPQVHFEEDYRYLRLVRGPGAVLLTAGRDGLCARSDDLGRIWTREAPGLAGEIRALAIAPDGTAFAGGEGGRVVRRRVVTVP